MQRHVQLLGNLPSSVVPGELRRYRAVLGPKLLPIQLNLERAWAAAKAEGEQGATVEEVEEVRRALQDLPPLRSPSREEPIVDGPSLSPSLAPRLAPSPHNLPPGVIFLRSPSAPPACTVRRRSDSQEGGTGAG